MHTRTYRLLILAAWIAVVGLASLSFTTPAISAISVTTGYPSDSSMPPPPWIGHK